MALALNSSHPLASAVSSLIAVDANTGTLVDLKTARTFTVDTGVTFIDDATNGKVLRTAGADASSAKGFSFTPAISMATQVAGFGSTMFLVLAKHAGDDAGLASYKNNTPVGGNVMIYHPVPVFTSQTNGRKIALSSVNTDTYDAAKTSSISIYGDGLRHTVATTASNAAGGWSSVAGKLYVDGADTGIAVTGGAGDAVFGAFNNLANSLWRGDFLYWVFFNRVLTSAEISSLHASVGNANAFGLVTGQPSGASAPTGTVTVGTVTVGTTTASVPFSYSAADQTGYDYRLNGGAVVSGGTSSPISVTGLTAGTAYAIEVRATNATGAGAWSASKAFTTSAAAATPTITIPNLLKNNAGAPLINLTNITATIIRASDKAGVATVTGLSTNASGTLSPITHASLVSGVAYHIAVFPTEGGGGLSKAIVAS